MKLNKTKSLLLLAMAGLMLVSPAAKAATVAYSSDDLLLGFTAVSGTGAGTNYVVDLGQASLFTSAGSGGTVATSYDLSAGALGHAIGNLNADLVATYGANWATDGLVTYGVVGSTGQTTGAVGSDPSKTLYATNAQTSSGAPGTPQSVAWNADAGIGQTSQSTASGHIGGSASLGTAFNGQTSTTNDAFGIVENATNTPANSWQALTTGSTYGSNNFGAFNPSVSGAASNALDLYRGTYAGAGAGSPYGFVGNFQLSPTGDLSFESAPEPGRAVLLSFGLAAALLRRRRKTANA